LVFTELDQQVFLLLGYKIKRSDQKKQKLTDTGFWFGFSALILDVRWFFSGFWIMIDIVIYQSTSDTKMHQIFPPIKSKTAPFPPCCFYPEMQ